VYNEALPDVWYNARGVTTAQRMFNDAAGNTVVVHEDSVAGLLDEHGEVILSVNDIAYSALKFISKTGAFYVRELSGGLIDEEKNRSRGSSDLGRCAPPGTIAGWKSPCVLAGSVQLGTITPFDLKALKGPAMSVDSQDRNEFWDRILVGS
jgi:hypothetical protein